jgi:hypothetical protein
MVSNARGGNSPKRGKERVLKMKKAPKIGASEWNLFCKPLFRARPGYFFFFAGAFFFGAAFFVALFID